MQYWESQNSYSESWNLFDSSVTVNLIPVWTYLTSEDWLSIITETYNGNTDFIMIDA